MKAAVGWICGYLLPSAFWRAGSLTLCSGTIVKISAQRKEVKGSEEEAEFSPGSSGVIGLFLWLCGVCLQGNQIEMSEVWSGFHG
jgi:hypothetical protein